MRALLRLTLLLLASRVVLAAETGEVRIVHLSAQLAQQRVAVHVTLAQRGPIAPMRATLEVTARPDAKARTDPVVLFTAEVEPEALDRAAGLELDRELELTGLPESGPLRIAARLTGGATAYREVRVERPLDLVIAHLVTRPDGDGVRAEAELRNLGRATSPRFVVHWAASVRTPTQPDPPAALDVPEPAPHDGLPPGGTATVAMRVAPDHDRIGTELTVRLELEPPSTPAPEDALWLAAESRLDLSSPPPEPDIEVAGLYARYDEQAQAILLLPWLVNRGSQPTGPFTGAWFRGAERQPVATTAHASLAPGASSDPTSASDGLAAWLRPEPGAGLQFEADAGNAVAESGDGEGGLVPVGRRESRFGNAYDNTAYLASARRSDAPAVLAAVTDLVVRVSDDGRQILGDATIACAGELPARAVACTWMVDGTPCQTEQLPGLEPGESARQKPLAVPLGRTSSRSAAVALAVRAAGQPAAASRAFDLPLAGASWAVTGASLRRRAGPLAVVDVKVANLSDAPVFDLICRADLPGYAPGRIEIPGLEPGVATELPLTLAPLSPEPPRMREAWVAVDPASVSESAALARRTGPGRATSPAIELAADAEPDAFDLVVRLDPRPVRRDGKLVLGACVKNAGRAPSPAFTPRWSLPAAAPGAACRPLLPQEVDVLEVTVPELPAGEVAVQAPPYAGLLGDPTPEDNVARGTLLEAR